MNFKPSIEAQTFFLLNFMDFRSFRAKIREKKIYYQECLGKVMPLEIGFSLKYSF